MNVIQKSLLDLIPLTVVAVVIALISANTVRDVSQTYDNIISVEAEVLVKLRDAQNAILQWNADVKEGASLVRNNGDKAKEKFQSATFTIDEYLFNLRSARQTIETFLTQAAAGKDGPSKNKANDPKALSAVDLLNDSEMSLSEILALIDGLETEALAINVQQLRISKLSLGTGAEFDQAVSEMGAAQNKLGDLVILALSANARAAQSVSAVGSDLIGDVQVLNKINLDVLDIENVLFDIEDIRKKLTKLWGSTENKQIARQSAYITMLKARLSALDFLIEKVKGSEAEIKDLIASRANVINGKDRLSLFILSLIHI